MIVKFEKLTDSLDLDEEGKALKNFSEVAEKDATHIHYCRHDEIPARPCRREEI